MELDYNLWLKRKGIILEVLFLGYNDEIEMIWKPENYLTIDENSPNNYEQRFCLGTYAWS